MQIIGGHKTERKIHIHIKTPTKTNENSSSFTSFIAIHCIYVSVKKVNGGLVTQEQAVSDDWHFQT